MTLFSAWTSFDCLNLRFIDFHDHYEIYMFLLLFSHRASTFLFSFFFPFCLCYALCPTWAEALGKWAAIETFVYGDS